MKKHTTVVIGAGQCGLAMSRELSSRNIDHVVLERGQIANSWRKECWDGMRLLSPNWQNDLPGECYYGPDVEGYMTATEFADYLEHYVSSQTDENTRDVASVLRRGLGGYIL